LVAIRGYALHMRSVFLLSLCFLVTSLADAQKSPPKSVQEDRSEPPVLPVIDEDACPFEGCTFGEWTVTKETPLYSSWKKDRVETGRLRKGEKVAGLTGVHITEKPDTIRVLKDIPELSLKRGDTFYRYMYRGEGFADIWAHGEWKKETDCSFVTEKETGGCLRDCSAQVVEDGVKEWWVKVRTKSGREGWTKAADNFDGMDSLA
jgi:hypothetical protein